MTNSPNQELFISATSYMHRLALLPALYSPPPFQLHFVKETPTEKPSLPN